MVEGARVTQRIRWTVMLTAGLSMSQIACSVHIIKPVTTDLSARKLQCTQSNLWAGRDLTLTVFAGAVTVGGAYQSITGDDEMFPSQLTTLAVTALAAVATSIAGHSMLYGFSETSKCRERARELKLRVRGGFDWLYWVTHGSFPFGW